MEDDEMLNASVIGDSGCIGCGSYDNATYDCQKLLSAGHVIVASVCLALITMATVVGNLLVMASVFLERSLRTAANLLIVSLAAADLLVALLVMPLSAVNQVEGCWILGPEVCSVWIFFDVLCCTSSIYHLVAIAFDRFWAVSRSDYIHNRSTRSILVMIALSWTLSAVIAAPPLLGWTLPHGSDLDRTGQCLISQDLAYTVFSTVGAFYLPLVTIVGVYANVYCKARDRILRRRFKVDKESLRSARSLSPAVCDARAANIATAEDDRTMRMQRLRNEVAVATDRLSSSVSNRMESDRLGKDDVTNASRRRTSARATSSTDYEIPEATAVVSTTMLCANSSSSAVRSSAVRSSVDRSSVDLPKSCRKDEGSEEAAPGATKQTVQTSSGRCAVALSPASNEKTVRRRKMELKRERKAARTLSVITGSFVCCWLPFFVVATLRPVCGQRCQFPHLLTSVILWLGYVNSLLNPMIYTLFNPDFRLAFRKILLGKYHR